MKTGLGDCSLRVTHLNGECSQFLVCNPAAFTLQNSLSPTVWKFYVSCICLHWSDLHLVQFHKWKRWINCCEYKTLPFGLLHNMESLFSDNQLWLQQICWSVWVMVAICQATGKICFLNTTHGHLQSWSTRLKLLVVEANYMQLCWTQRHIPQIYQCMANMWLHACTHIVCFHSGCC